jgi:putative transposase
MKKTRGKLQNPEKVKSKSEPLETLWEIPDSLWERIEPILMNLFPEAPTGRPRANWRQIINRIIYQFRTGCQWNHLPEQFGSDRTVHRWFTKWCRSGVFIKIWSEIAKECDDLGEVYWEWQAADGCLEKARMGGDKVGKNPTDRGKNGTKKSFLVDQEGGPLAVMWQKQIVMTRNF